MTRLVATLFRKLLDLIILLLFLAVIGGAVVFWMQGGPAWRAVLGGALGCLAVIAVFGALALMIENNALLRRIAKAAERGGMAPGQVVGPAAPPVRPGGRVEPALRAGAGRG